MAFWIGLTLATATLGTVYLAPRLVVWHHVKDRHLHVVAESTALHRELDHLSRSVTALRNDPLYRTEALRKLKAATSASEQVDVLPVTADLAFDGRSRSRSSRFDQPYEPEWLPLCRQLAVNGPVRTGCLWSGSLLLIASLLGWVESPRRTFTFALPLQAGLRRLANRYASR